MGIFGDKVRQSFGFPTQKESLDYRIDNYQRRELSGIEHSLAKRNVEISYFQEQIRQLEQIIKQNQFFIDSYELMKREASEKISLGNSSVVSVIYGSDGNMIARGNYSTLASYKESLVKSGANYQIISQYINELGHQQEVMWQEYANGVIIGKGYYNGGSRDVDECFPIYNAYVQAVNYMKAGQLRDGDRRSNMFRTQNMELMIKLYQLAMSANSVLSLALQVLQTSVDTLNSAQASDEYAKTVIEETKTMLRTTTEYFKAKQSQEYLDEINKLK